MSSTEALDSVLMILAHGLGGGQLTADQVRAELRKPRIVAGTDGESVKILLRMSFIKFHFDRESALPIATVAHMLAQVLRKPEIDFSASIGVGNAVTCAAYVRALHLNLAGRPLEAAEVLTALLPVIEADGEWSGLLEARHDLGHICAVTDNWKAAALHFESALEILTGHDVVEASSQKMVRGDNEGVFDFGLTSALPDIPANELLALLAERRGSALIQLGAWPQAYEVSLRAYGVAMAAGSRRAQICLTHGAACIGLKLIAEAKVAATEAKQITETMPHPLFGPTALMMLAYCANAEGDLPLFNELSAAARAAERREGPGGQP